MTKSDEKEERNLSPKQELAADLLAAGETISGAAEKVGVARQTLSEWFNHSQEFRIAIESRRAEVWQTMTNKLRALVPKAIEALEQELSGVNRMRAAAQILKLAGLHNAPTPLAPEDVQDLKYGRSMREAFNSVKPIADALSRRDKE
jgi:transposase-like protein